MVIYVIENKINGMKYVGQTKKTSQERWKEHIREAKRCQKKCIRLSRAIEKYGKDSFAVYNIDTADSWEELDKKEQYWIRALNTLSPNGYNLTSGGRKYSTLSKESREKISKANKGRKLTEEQRKRLSERVSGEKHPLYGKHHSEETKRKISESHIGKYDGEKNPNYGKHWSDEWKKKVSQMHKDYYKTHEHPNAMKTLCVETGVIYKSATHAYRDTGIHNSMISRACKGILKTAGGYHWKYADKGDD